MDGSRHDQPASSTPGDEPVPLSPGAGGSDEMPGNPVEPSRTAGDIPRAFYRDDPPPPPPGDPHWREWPDEAPSEAPPLWIILGIPGFIALTALLHVLFVFIPVILQR